MTELYPKNHPRNPDRRLSPEPPPAASEADPRAAAALAGHSARQKDQAAELRRRSKAIRDKLAARMPSAVSQGMTAENWRIAEGQGAEAEASDLDRRAARCELRAQRADEGKLLHSSAENSDVDYLQRGGYALLRLDLPRVTE